MESDVEIPNKVRIAHSDHFADIVNAFLTKEPQDRLGSASGSAEIFAHPWFTDRSTQEGEDLYIDIEEVLQSRMPAPI